MPPRKASADASSEPPRRSTRISAQPKEDQPEKPTTTSKKRAANEPAAADALEESSASKKKVKSDNLEEEESDSPQDTLASIDIGDLLPSLVLKNEKNEDIQIENLAAEKGVVLFLVPKANTPGCTTQACGFRDIYPDFSSLNYDVYCLSPDGPSVQANWQTKKELPYPLISDPKRFLISALGAGAGGKTQRSHFIFEKGGKLLDKKIPVKPAESPELALEFIKGL